MTESVKTTIYVGVAAVIALIAFVTSPSAVSNKSNKPTAELFDFSDPLAAKSLEITRFDDKLGEFQNFKVAQAKNGSWVIPSHFDYPADAEKQLKEAATSLIGLQPIGIATERADEHKLFGVIEPNKDKLKLGDEGVGTLVKLRNEKGDTLANLVVGKKVDKAEGQRFVRIPPQDQVYVVKFDLEKLSTSFDTWIEKDLLKLNPFDVEQIRLKDYSIVPTNQGLALDMRLEAAVRFNSTDSKWELEELATFNRQKKIPTKLLEDEELNKEKLDGLKTALDELKIVDVQRKPKGLSADLQAEELFLKDADSRQSLSKKGFFVASNPAGGKTTELYAANGEVYIGMKDGYEYVLRFGNIAGAEEGSSEAKLNRYLFVTARMDDAKFAPPQLEPEPAEPANVPAPVPPAPAPPKKIDGQNGDGAADDEPPAPATKVEPKKDAAKSDADKTEAAKPAEEKTAPKKEAADEQKPPVPALDEKKPEPKKLDPVAERERIKKENARKMTEWSEKKKKAKTQVDDLNARFADWYYVISEDTYKKIHLGRADIIKEKAASQDEGSGVDAFRKLEKSGFKKEPVVPIQ